MWLALGLSLSLRKTYIAHVAGSGFVVFLYGKARSTLVRYMKVLSQIWTVRFSLKQTYIPRVAGCGCGGIPLGKCAFHVWVLSVFRIPF